MKGHTIFAFLYYDALQTHILNVNVLLLFLLKLAKKDMQIKKIYYICDVIKMLREENKLLDL